MLRFPLAVFLGMTQSNFCERLTEIEKKKEGYHPGCPINFQLKLSGNTRVAPRRQPHTFGLMSRMPFGRISVKSLGAKESEPVDEYPPNAWGFMICMEMFTSGAMTPQPVWTI